MESNDFKTIFFDIQAKADPNFWRKCLDVVHEFRKCDPVNSTKEEMKRVIEIVRFITALGDNEILSPYGKWLEVKEFLVGLKEEREYFEERYASKCAETMKEIKWIE